MPEDTVPQGSGTEHPSYPGPFIHIPGFFFLIILCWDQEDTLKTSCSDTVPGLLGLSSPTELTYMSRENSSAGVAMAWGPTCHWFGSANQESRFSLPAKIFTLAEACCARRRPGWSHLMPFHYNLLCLQSSEISSINLRPPAMWLQMSAVPRMLALCAVSCIWDFHEKAVYYSAIFVQLIKQGRFHDYL